VVGLVVADGLELGTTTVSCPAYASRISHYASAANYVRNAPGLLCGGAFTATHLSFRERPPLSCRPMSMVATTAIGEEYFLTTGKSFQE